jgi:hypothetical protein
MVGAADSYRQRADVEIGRNAAQPFNPNISQQVASKNGANFGFAFGDP